MDRSLRGRDLSSLAARAERLLAEVESLKQQFGPMLRPTEPVTTPPSSFAPLADALRSAFIGYSLNRLPDFTNTILRPVHAEAQWVDQPTLHSVPARANPQDAAKWKAAFPDFDHTVINVVGNESYTMVEYKASGTHLGTLQLGRRTLRPSRTPLTVHGALVVTIQNGHATRFEHYYDLAGIMVALGLLPNVMMGHDEPVRGLGGLPPLPSANKAMLPPTRDWPVVAVRNVTSNVSIGESNSPASQRNIANCAAIHKAFVTRNPAMFQQLIAPH